jgi:hypothetical protein
MCNAKFRVAKRAFSNLIHTFSKQILTVNTAISTALAFAITIWMKTDKFSQVLTTQRNGRQSMQRMNFRYGIKSKYYQHKRKNGIANRKN